MAVPIKQSTQKPASKRRISKREVVGKTEGFPTSSIEQSTVDHSSTLSRISQQSPVYRKADISIWNLAIRMAEDVTNPRRAFLLDIYRSTVKDGHVRGQMRTRRIKVTGEPFFLIDDKYNVMQEHTELINKPWMRALITHFIDACFYGFSVVEFMRRIPSTSKLVQEELTSPYLIPREHCIPEHGIIVLNPFDQQGIDYRHPALQDQILEMGDAYDLGLLETISRNVIYKQYSRTDWARHSEKFGMPIVAYNPPIGTTNEELEAIATGLANLGNNSWFVGKPGSDQLPQNLLDKAGDPYKMYLELMRYLDSENSVVLVGQNMTASDGSSLSQAEVHERILEEICLSDMQAWQDYCNSTLLPFLIRNGYPLEGLKFCFGKLYQKVKNPSNGFTDPEPLDPAQVPNPALPVAGKNTPANRPAPKPAEKESTKTSGSLPTNKLSSPFMHQLQHFYEECCGLPSKELSSDDSTNLPGASIPTKEQEEFITAFYANPSMELAPVSYVRSTFKTLSQAFIKGSKAIPKNLSSLEDASVQYLPDPELSRIIESNLWFFSEAKGVAQLQLLREAILDADGIVPKEQFLTKARDIVAIFNRAYLSAEYEYVVAAGQMASKWLDIKKGQSVAGYLEYSAVMDQRTRVEHSAMQGITLPVDHPFWDTHYPPNGWNCRCSVIPVAGGNITPEASIVKPVLPKGFSNNVGKTGKVFSKDHPFMQAMQDNNVNLSSLQNRLDQFKSNRA